MLLLSAAASAATIALAACIVKRKRKRAERFWMRPLFQWRHERGAYKLQHAHGRATTYGPRK